MVCITLMISLVVIPSQLMDAATYEHVILIPIISMSGTTIDKIHIWPDWNCLPSEI